MTSVIHFSPVSIYALECPSLFFPKQGLHNRLVGSVPRIAVNENSSL